MRRLIEAVQPTPNSCKREDREDVIALGQAQLPRPIRARKDAQLKQLKPRRFCPASVPKPQQALDG